MFFFAFKVRRQKFKLKLVLKQRATVLQLPRTNMTQDRTQAAETRLEIAYLNFKLFRNSRREKYLRKVTTNYHEQPVVQKTKLVCQNFGLSVFPAWERTIWNFYISQTGSANCYLTRNFIIYFSTHIAFASVSSLISHKKFLSPNHIDHMIMIRHTLPLIVRMLLLQLNAIATDS